MTAPHATPEVDPMRKRARDHIEEGATLSETILATEEEHADDLTSLLRVIPQMAVPPTGQFR